MEIPFFSLRKDKKMHFISMIFKIFCLRSRSGTSIQQLEMWRKHERRTKQMSNCSFVEGVNTNSSCADLGRAMAEWGSSLEGGLWTEKSEVCVSCSWKWQVNKHFKMCFFSFLWMRFCKFPELRRWQFSSYSSIALLSKNIALTSFKSQIDWWFKIINQ